mgnify:FL=1
MISPDIPHDEAIRLATLQSLNLLDTPEEERFDRLTRLAKRMFNVPMALVSLVDENRQWFKSSQGFAMSETPRDISFCGHAILGEGIFIVPDALNDSRFSDNPLAVNDPYIRFYAGCPLKSLDGSKLGTLCIMDKVARTLSQDDLGCLKDLAEMAERELAAVQLATLDELTQISNRRGFIALAQKSLNICYRQGLPVSLVFFDLNKFKAINDTFGHGEGDKALIVFADKMKHSFRDADVFARLGGDEFVVLLSNTSVLSAQEIIDRFAQSLADYNQKAQSGYDILFSEGIVSPDIGQAENIETLLEQADAVMYKNKHA